MASGRRRKKKKRKALFAVEMVILALLTVVLLVCIWATQKFNLLNRKDLDEDRLFTSDEVNNPSGEEGGSRLTGVDLFALVGIDYREGNEAQNSDTLIIACVNHNDKTIKLVSVYRDTYLNINGPYDDGYYFTKCNAAYNAGGPEQMLTMLNLNLDLDITKYVTVDFTVVADVVDALGGIDVDLTREECVHLNNHLVETSEVCGVEYDPIDIPDQSVFDGVITQTFHLDGAKAVAYSRIRQTTGDDFRRTARQRNVINKIFEKAKKASLGTLDSIMNAVFPQIETNLTNTEILSMIQPLMSYTITTEQGFPTRYEAGVEIVEPVTGLDCVVPHTLEQNVIELHELLFPGETYTPSQTVTDYSEYLEWETGFTEYNMPDPTDYGKLQESVTLEEAQAQGFDGTSEDDYDSEDYSYDDEDYDSGDYSYYGRDSDYYEPEDYRYYESDY